MPKKLALEFLMASSQFELNIGTMPRRCAMNSSGSTVVLTSISTMSIADECLDDAQSVRRIIREKTHLQSVYLPS
jgi:hypothetical protein